MNIKILDSWLREHLKTKAKAEAIARTLSLTSVSVEKLEKHGEDFIYDIEITTNRVDLMSVLGIAKEASAVLPEHGIASEFVHLKMTTQTRGNSKFPIEIKNDPEIVNRICAVVMEVNVKQSPKIIKDRLEASGIRSLNNLIDVTNYVMREIGHPAHVFDFDRLNTKSLTIRKSRKGSVVKTLDGKTHTLLGGDIVAENDKGEIVDLLGIMGTTNSVVNESTKKILYFIDNNNPVNIRNTSMSLGIRTEAAVLNEKGVDPSLAMDALIRGIELFKEIADGKVVSEILDIYPNISKNKTIKLSLSKINDVIGVEIPKVKSEQILVSLGFGVKKQDEDLSIEVPSARLSDIETEEDIIEEIARVFGYEKLPTVLPTFLSSKPYKLDNEFYFEQRLKNAMRYLGFTEVYSYSMVSEDVYEGPIDQAVKIKNPLSEDMVYLRSSLTPSLLSVLSENKKREVVKIFEVANIYHKKQKTLPIERLTFAGLIKSRSNSFFDTKGLIESVLEDLGITGLKFKEKDDGIGALVYKDNEELGYIEQFNSEVINFEFDFGKILSHANIKKSYKPLAKFPPIIEDLSVEVGGEVSTYDIIKDIKSQSELIAEVSLLDQFGEKKTFHIIYQNPTRNLTLSEISKVREQIKKSLQKNFSATI